MSNSRFYTNCTCIGNNILYRGVKDGERIAEKFTVQPTLFLPSSKPTKYKTLDGKYADKIKFGDINEAKEFVRRYEGVDNFVYYGNTKYHYVYLGDKFPNTIDYDFSEIVVSNLDIEVGSENGFPDPSIASEEVTAITIKLDGRYYALGCNDFVCPDGVDYLKCENEVQLLKRFLDLWILADPDIITGWSVKFFDIPYLVNRFRKILGEDETRNLSPWRYISERQTIINGRKMIAYGFVGVESLRTGLAKNPALLLLSSVPLAFNTIPDAVEFLPAYLPIEIEFIGALL